MPAGRQEGLNSRSGLRAGASAEGSREETAPPVSRTGGQQHRGGAALTHPNSRAGKAEEEHDSDSRHFLIPTLPASSGQHQVTDFK